MAIDLLSYRGDAGLGMGSNPNLDAPVNQNAFDTINQAARDLGNWAMQKNARDYQQKLKERDDLLNMIASDQISTEKILPEYLPEIEKAKEAQIKAFEEWGGDFNNTKGYLKYKEANQAAKDLATMAQINTVGIMSIRGQKANEPVASRHKQYDDFEKAELGVGLSDFVRPFQKNTNSDFGKLLQTISGVPQQQKAKDSKSTTPTSSGVSFDSKGNPQPFKKGASSIINYDDYLGRAAAQYMEMGEGKDQQDLLIESFENADPRQSRVFIDSINKRLRDYNEETKGQDGATPVTEMVEGRDFIEEVLPDGQRKIRVAMNAPEFAAKFALAHTPGRYFQDGGIEFDKDIADYLIKQDNVKNNAKRLGIADKRANAYVRSVNEKIKQLQKNGIDEQQTNTLANAFFDDPQIGMNVLPYDPKNALGNTGSGAVFYVDKIPSNYQNVIFTKNKSGDFVNDKIDPFVSSDGRPYLESKIFDNNNNEIKVDKKFLDAGFAEQKKVTPNISFEDYRRVVQNEYKNLIKDGTLKVNLFDKSGNIIDASSIKDAYKNINNRQASGKYKNNLFLGSDEDDNIDDLD